MARMSPSALAFASAGLLAGLTTLVQPVPALAFEAQYAAAPHACWGQATKVFAQLGEVGTHASQQGTPRLGLARLARAL
jgi:hypothetical protein